MEANKSLQIILGIGKDLLDLAYQQVNELKSESPETMHQNLIDLRGEVTRISPALYSFH